MDIFRAYILFSLSQCHQFQLMTKGRAWPSDSEIMIELIRINLLQVIKLTTRSGIHPMTLLD